MKIVLKGERPISWNKFYSGTHWTKRQAIKNSIHGLVRYTLKEMGVHNGMIDGRVDISIVAYFRTHPQDADNICSKLYIDGLVGNLIEDDSRKFVRKVSTQSEIDKENPRVEIEVLEI